VSEEEIRTATHPQCALYMATFLELRQETVQTTPLKEIRTGLRYESRTTKSPELAFRALLDGDGARDVSFERVLAGYP
jgi:hypothetical protein